MMSDAPTLPHGYSASRVFYPAGLYEHPPAGLLQLRVVRRGSSYAEIDLGLGIQRVFTRPGDLLLSLPSSAVRLKIDDGRDLTLLQVTPDLTRRLLAEYDGTVDDLAPITKRPFRDSLIAELCRRMEDLDFTGSPLGDRSLDLVLGLLLSCAKKRPARGQSHVLLQSQLDEVIRFIDEHLPEPITVEQLARIVGFKVRAFSVAFKGATALPVYQFVLRRRVERAMALLAQTNLTSSAIAQDTGFSHQAHMTRVMKRLFDRTPAQLRNLKRD